MISKNLQNIYNLHLRSYRIHNNKPFRAKKKFDDIEKNEEIISSLCKIESIFNKYPSFYSNIYFDAPYKIHIDEHQHYPLKFYASHKGITTCMAYIKALTKSNPEEQFEFMKQSYKFVANFCIEHGIKLSQYVNYCSISQNDCLKHLKEHKISWYLIFSIPGFYDLLYNLPIDEFELYYGNEISLSNLYDRYQSSFKTVEFLNKIHQKISTFVENTCIKT